MSSDREAKRQILSYPMLVPRPILGETYAEKEWDEHEVRSAKMFIHTASYLEFQGLNVLFLFGRRGTGKTSIIRMLEHDVLREKVKTYSFCRRLDQESAFHEFSIQIRTSPLSELPPVELVHKLHEKWRWLLSVTAMQAVLEGVMSVSEIPSCLEPVHEYLKENELLPGSNQSPLEHIVRLSVEAFRGVEHVPTKACIAIYDVLSALTSSSFKGARDAMHSYLIKNHQKCLVLVDSIEYYSLDDEIAKAVRTALIDTVRDFYDCIQRQGICVKAAFPSEVFPHLTIHNKEKVGSRNLFILWQYHDLVSLVAKRYLAAFSERFSAIISSKSMNDYKSARDFLYNLMPSTVTTRVDINFDTMAYFIEHTQKKPREVLDLFNCVLTHCEARDHDNYPYLTETIIRNGIHMRLDLLVSGALNMYEQIYPQADQLIRSLLTGMPSLFTLSQLDTRIKEISSMRAKSNLAIYQVNRLLLECGALGQVLQVHKLLPGDKEIVEAIYEYQVKDTLTLSSNNRYAIHPMFYQELQSVLSNNQLTYPTPAEDTEISALEQAGINLG